MDERSKLVNNERLKLLATFMNGIAIAVFAVGGLAPLFSGLYGPSGVTRLLVLMSGVCFSGAFALHYGASTILRGLRP
jgi:hypothetical protein